MSFPMGIKGYAVLRLTGKKCEENLEKIRKKGLMPYSISHRDDGIRLSLSYRDYLIFLKMKNIQFFVEDKKGGVFFVEKVKKRKILLFALILTAIAVVVSSSFIWTVEYEGVSDGKLAEVQKASELAGIKVGAFKPRLLSPLELKNTILANSGDIAWCWVYIKGTRAVVKVRENIIPPDIINPHTPCNVVAAKPGVIRKIITKRGSCQAEDNTPVSPGDVLISGRVGFGDDEGYFVHASGICEADTYYCREGVYKLYKTYKTYTGRKRKFLALKIFRYRIPLYFNGKNDFKYSDKEEKLYEISLGKDNYIGIGLEKISHIEYNVMREPISPETCAELAKRELESEIARELLPGAVLKNSEITTTQIDNETISVALTMEFTENIAAEKCIEEVTLIEPKTD